MKNSLHAPLYNTKSKLTNLVLLAFFALMLFPELAIAQPWTYDFGTGTGNPSGAFTSGTASTTYLPTPPLNGGTARVRVGTNPGNFTLVNPGLAGLGAESELQFASNTGSVSTSKFSIYDWTTATKVGYVKFNIAFSV